MIIDLAELNDVLSTFTGQEFAVAITSARRLAGMAGISISRSDSLVPTIDLRMIYARRAMNPQLRQVLAQQCDRLAQIAALFPDERWRIYIVMRGDDPQVTIFSNQEAVGRVCLDYTTQD